MTDKRAIAVDDHTLTLISNRADPTADDLDRVFHDWNCWRITRAAR
jgi:hypothetical protein